MNCGTLDGALASRRARAASARPDCLARQWHKAPGFNYWPPLSISFARSPARSPKAPEICHHPAGSCVCSAGRPPTTGWLAGWQRALARLVRARFAQSRRPNNLSWRRTKAARRAHKRGPDERVSERRLGASSCLLEFGRPLARMSAERRRLGRGCAGERAKGGPPECVRACELVRPARRSRRQRESERASEKERALRRSRPAATF